MLPKKEYKCENLSDDLMKRCVYMHTKSGAHVLMTKNGELNMANHWKILTRARTILTENLP